MCAALSEEDIAELLGVDDAAAAAPPAAAPPAAAPPAPIAQAQTPAQADTSPFTPAELLEGLVGGAVVYHRPAFLPVPLANRWFEALRPGGAAGIAWARRKIIMYGREVTEARATAFYGDPGTAYRYSGKNHIPNPWTDDPSGTLAEALAAVRRATGLPFNFVLANLYGPGDSIGAHSDDERDLVRGTGIFSVSLGCPRLFKLEPRGGAGGPPPVVALRLAHGSAVWMLGLTQQAYKHRVDAEKASGEPTLRVNLTFRCVRVATRQ